MPCVANAEGTTRTRQCQTAGSHRSTLPRNGGDMEQHTGWAKTWGQDEELAISILDCLYNSNNINKQIMGITAASEVWNQEENEESDPEASGSADPNQAMVSFASAPGESDGNTRGLPQQEVRKEPGHERKGGENTTWDYLGTTTTACSEQGTPRDNEADAHTALEPTGEGNATVSNASDAQEQNEAHNAAGEPAPADAEEGVKRWTGDTAAPEKPPQRSSTDGEMKTTEVEKLY